MRSLYGLQKQYTGIIRNTLILYGCVHLCMSIEACKTCNNMNMKIHIYDCTCILYTQHYIYVHIHNMCITKTHKTNTHKIQNTTSAFSPSITISLRQKIASKLLDIGLAAPQTKAGNWRRRAPGRQSSKWCPSPWFAWPHTL